jgi:hypothetical protein
MREIGTATDDLDPATGGRGGQPMRSPLEAIAHDPRIIRASCRGGCEPVFEICPAGGDDGRAGCPGRSPRELGDVKVSRRPSDGQETEQQESKNEKPMMDRGLVLAWLTPLARASDPRKSSYRRDADNGIVIRAPLHQLRSCR